MKFLLLPLICLSCVTSLFAQDDYQAKAAALQKEIWGAPAAEFKSTTVPANLANESAVILARSFSCQRTSGGRFKFLLVGAGIAIHTEKVSTLHERVKINDKPALENYSTLEYQKLLDKTVSLLIAHFTNTHNTFIGAKIIKPDGKEVIVNTGEEVLTKNETKDKQGKLAIPDLQVGDILDYYITNIDVTENEADATYKNNDNIFVMADEYPVLYYAIDLQYARKLSVRHIYANGAPHFEESHNNDGDLLLSLKLHNLPKFQSQLWTSSYRQYPYIEVASAFKDSYEKVIAKNNYDERTAMLEANKLFFEDSFIEYTSDFDNFEKGLKNSFGSNKAFKAAPLDTVMKVLYNQWKYKTFNFYYKEDFDDIPSINFRKALSRNNVPRLCFILNDLQVDYDVLLVASRNSSTLDNVFNPSDFDAMIRINGARPMYMGFDDAVTHFNEIPGRFQGEKVIVLHPKRKNTAKYTFTESEDVLPVSPADQNFLEYNQKISLMPDMRKLKIDRVVREGGALGHDDQKALLSTSAIDGVIATLGRAEAPDTRFRKYQDKQVYWAGLQASEDNAKAELDKKLTGEIKSSFDQEPIQLSNCKIDNTGIEDASPVFQYSETFVLDNLVKKAGNNYIIDAGKLTGSFLKLEAKDRKRSADIYMPVARTLKYSVALTIPTGFKVKGAEELNAKKVNKTGSFTLITTVNGNTLNISVTRVYNHNFEKAADWPSLVELIDAASNFNEQKILLEKS